ncbi:7040_t:CDS:2, partial [Ambispora gerdemannii]
TEYILTHLHGLIFDSAQTSYSPKSLQFSEPTAIQKNFAHVLSGRANWGGGNWIGENTCIWTSYYTRYHILSIGKFDDVKCSKQRRLVDRYSNIIVATPGRLWAWSQ